MDPVTAQGPVDRTELFFGNVVWSWLGVAVNLFLGVAVSPYIVRKIGDEGYGVWTLVLGLVDYYWLLDFGFRSATLKYSAEYRATNEPEKINEIVNTALFYAAGVGLLVLGITAVLPQQIVELFQISPAYQRIFVRLMMIVGVGWAVGIVFNMFGACLEGFQRFDITNRIWILTNTLRAVSCVALLALGYGLVEMAMAVVASQILGYAMSYVAMRRIFAEWRLSPRLVRSSGMRQMLGYGTKTFVALVGTRTLLQAPPMMIGHFLPAAFVGYFGLPTRLLQYASDIVSRVGMVTGSTASELSAKREEEAIPRLGIYINRYCFVIFVPLAVLFLIYGAEIIRVWISPRFSAQSAPLLPILVLSSGVALAGQYNSASILYGLGKHGAYARSLLVEAVLTVAALAWAIPHYGILGAAWVTGVLMILNRGVVVPVLLCRNLHFNPVRYLREIFTRPTLAAIPVLALAWALKMSLLPGRNVVQLLLVAAVVGFSYYGLAFFVCVWPEHRAAMVRWVAARSRNAALGKLGVRL